MAIKWGSTYVTAVKWGSTICTQVKWGSTVVFPNSTGYNGSSFDFPIASGFNNGVAISANFKNDGFNTGYKATTSKNNINFSMYKTITITWETTRPKLGNQEAWSTLDSVSCAGTSASGSIYGANPCNADISSITSTGTLYIRIYYQYNGSGKPDLTVTFTIKSIVFS